MRSRSAFLERALRPVGLVTIIVIAMASCSQSDDGSSPSSGVGSDTPAAEFEWSMTPRFGLDENGDGRPDIPNTFEYVHNLERGSCSAGCAALAPEFTVELDASGSLRGRPEIDQYVWEIRGDGLDPPIELRSAGAQAAVRLPEGVFQIALTITGEGFAESVSESIVIDDILIVALGDSYASGEGNPEIPGAPATWADDGAPAASTVQRLSHDGAHRSGLAGPAQAALEIERADHHTSVTFVFLAASGVTIRDGVLGPFEGVTVGSGDRIDLRPQLEEAAEILGCGAGAGCDRPVDIVTLSVGGNDAGFSFTMGSLIALDGALFFDIVYDNLLDGIMVAAEGRLETLPGLFAELDRGLEILDPERVFITAYPSPARTVGSKGFPLCDEIAGDLVFALEVDDVESEQAETRVLFPLNHSIEVAAATHGWIYVSAHVQEFQGHGYCGAAPYEAADYPGNPFPDQPELIGDPETRWFRQADESDTIQRAPGGQFRPAQLATTGTLHPNELGHQAYKRALLDAMGYS